MHHFEYQWYIEVSILYFTKICKEVRMYVVDKRDGNMQNGKHFQNFANRS